MFDQIEKNPAQPQVSQAPQGIVESMPPVSVGDIHTMPDKFMGGVASRVVVKSAPGKRTVIMIVAIFFVLAGLTAGAYFYLQMPNNIFTGAKDNTTQTQQNTNQPVANENTTATTNEPTASDPAARERDTQRAADILVIAKALDQYYKQFSAYPQFLSVIPKEILAAVPTDPLSKTTYTYTPQNNRQSYTLVFDIEEEAQFRDKKVTKGTWEFLPEDFAEASPSNTNTDTQQPPAEPQQNLAVDSDGDGLTAAEEKLFGTSPDSQDTDSDGFKDASEISNFYSPMVTGNVKLDQAGLVSKYAAAADGFSFYYPSSWVAGVSPTNQKEVLITSDTGENFSITVSENSSNQTSWEWYSKNVSFDFNQDNVDIITVAGREAVRTLDGLRVYVAIDSKVLSIVYNLNTAGAVQYPNVFALLLNRLTTP